MKVKQVLCHDFRYGQLNSREVVKPFYADKPDKFNRPFSVNVTIFLHKSFC
jgi:hypothetical protein